VQQYGAEFLERWPQCPHVRQTLHDLALCRTPALGGHVTQCDHCGEVRYHYHSCGNRSCPQCGGSKRAAWLAKCQDNLLPVPYFHVVFTLPHELSALVLGNRKLLYQLLFVSAKDTLLEVAADPKHLGARIGVLMVLHTWGQKLEHHPHVHCVVPGGGLAVSSKTTGTIATAPGDQAPRWVSCRSNWFLSVAVLSQLYRGKYLAALRKAYHAGQLQFAGSTAPLASPAAWRTMIKALYQKEWVVYVKEPFGGPEQVLKYLSGYTHRVALSNHRLVKLQDNRITFTWKDYADGCRRKEMTLDAVEFVRRFALHIIPKGLVRIRHYGLLAHRDLGERLALCRSLLGAGPGPLPPPETESPPPVAESGSTASAQLPCEAGPAPSQVEPKSASPSRMGICILVVLVSLMAASGDTALFASSPVVPPAAVIVDDCCPACGVGHPQTIWQAARPGRRERQRIPILDSS
jgi:putative transposase/transposase-like zinc-binding protein